MRALLLIFILIFAGCMDEKVENNTSAEITDDIINEVNNELVVVYEIKIDNTPISIKKNEVTKNFTLKFTNPRNEDVYILIPDTEDNQKNYITLFLQNKPDYICRANIECEFTFNMVLGEQSNINSDFSFYLPVALLNGSEFARFIELNQIDKYKETAMKYLVHRVYIKYLLNASLI